MNSEEHQETAEKTKQVGRWALTGLVLMLATLVLGVTLGRGMTEDTKISDEVSVGFLQDMKVHHAQAVEMSEIVHRRSEDPAMISLAQDIMLTQQGQNGIMSGWLELSGQAQGSREVMKWMDHEGEMPGMASKEEIRDLEKLPPEAMDEQFLRLMIHHHEGAVPMAAYAAEHAEKNEVRRMAEKMEQGQASEIQLMQEMLQERGHEREESLNQHNRH